MLRRLLTVALASVVLMTSLGVTATAGAGDQKPWKPHPGVGFNEPTGDYAARAKLSQRVIDAIHHTRKGEKIRFAIYSFDLRPLADALLNAHKRGVRVQIVLNDNWTSAQTARLRRVLGHNPNKRNFVAICHGSCRGGPGNLHMKVYSFTKTGAAENVIMTGSANLTERAQSLQWNDLFTINGNDGLFQTFVHVFNELKLDKAAKPRWVTYSSGTYDAQFYRTHPGAERSSSSNTSSRLPSEDEDPVMKRLRDIRCDAVKGAGINGHTVIRIMMYGWSGDRGKYLARRVAYMQRNGCDVKAILSVAGGGVVKILHQAGIPMRSADWEYNDEGIVNWYSHLKTLSVNGTYQGKAIHTVWTGSENWSIMSFRNDELILQINKLGTYQSYREKFNTMWNGIATHGMGVKPTGRPGSLAGQ